MLIAHLQMLLLSNELHRCCCYFCSPDVLISVIKLKLRTTVWMINIVGFTLLVNIIYPVIYYKSLSLICVWVRRRQLDKLLFISVGNCHLYGTLLTVQVVAAQNLVVAREVTD